MNLSFVAKELGYSLPLEGEIASFEIDSRKVRAGSLFFAIKGEKVDPHLFLKDVAEKGAIAAVVASSYEGEDFGLPLIHTPDVLFSLQELARVYFAQRKRVVVAVTGSVGKTTTKEFIATLLQERFHVTKTPDSYNSQIGLSLSILNLCRDEEIFIAEMGMSRPHEIERLVQIAPPDIALITRLGLAHVALFPNGLEGVAAAKAEIFSHPRTRCGIVNAQACEFDVVLNTGKCEKQIFFSCAAGLAPQVHPPTDVLLGQTKEGWYIEDKVAGETSPSFSLPFEATHLCENFLAAALVARKLGMAWEEIIQRAQHLRPFKLRFEQIERQGITYINDCYNANPESMSAALHNLPAPKPGGKRVAVLGQMAEQGSFSESSHRKIGEVALNTVDHLICFGGETEPMIDIFKQAGKPVDFFLDIPKLRAHLHTIAHPGDVVLIKARNSDALWHILNPE